MLDLFFITLAQVTPPEPTTPNYWTLARINQLLESLLYIGDYLRYICVLGWIWFGFRLMSYAHERGNVRRFLSIRSRSKL